MQRHWLVTLQNLAATGRQWDKDVPMALLQDADIGEVTPITDLVSDVRWRIALQRSGRTFLLQGEWSGLIRRQCSRCNAPFDWQAAGETAWQFQLGDEPDRDEDASACEYLPPPGELNLLNVLREDVWLGWKSDVICSESCRGLCQGCGVDLNRECCRCARDESDHPFAALRGLKLDD